ncbi:MAG: 16S rRNA (adenine(1518)-N(6)/adenine(1519)-N(6))-dimethyltransferase RsmA [Spirochaetia bacterium]|jgi:16S rRNA (adenine1518-N6/adenine1519-N6)-dimethyltransferase|nr:16S rRNA (adenine(1518)-N(6)/adenine(1519)-N(6))-dimethyltransferase RsmA [Spirochaetia bacterium]
MNYNSPKDIIRLLAEKGFTPQKKFGQNFLVSGSVREQIVSAIDLRSSHKVWEIGPGLGSITELILEKISPESGGHLTVFEIDRGFAGLLDSLFKERIEIVAGDILKTWKNYSAENGMPDRIFGNLPYNTASVMIASFIEESFIPEKMVFTVQKEVAQRMVSSPGVKGYSSFSVLCQLACNVKIESEIKGGAFYPAPDVTSAIVSMTPHRKYDHIKNRKEFSRFLRMLFNSRRKTIFNNLKTIGKDEAEAVLEDEGISPGIRAEKLDPDQIVSLFTKVNQKVNS